MLFARNFLIILTLLSLCSISLAACTDSDMPSPAITISYGSTSVGSDEGNTDRQTMTFLWDLKNNSSEEVLLQWVQPDPSDELTGRLLTEDTRINVGKVIDAGETIAVEGAFTFDASGLTKDEIVEKCFITGMTVSTESTVKLKR